MKIKTFDEKGNPAVTDVPAGSHVAVVAKSALHKSSDGSYLGNDELFNISSANFSQHIVELYGRSIHSGPFINTGHVRVTTCLIVSPEPFTAEASVMVHNTNYGTDNADRVEWHKNSVPVSPLFFAENKILILEPEYEWIPVFVCPR